MTKEIKTTLIVTYKKGIPTTAFKEAKKGLKFKKEEKLKFTEQDILIFETEEEALKVKEKLEKRKNVESVAFDMEMDIIPVGATNEPNALSYNYHMLNNPNIPNDNFDWLKLKQINDNNPYTKNAVIALLDDGFKTDHPDLTGKLVDGYSSYEQKLESEGGTIYIPNYSNHGTLVVGMALAITNNGRDGSSIGGIFNNVKGLPISMVNPSTGTVITSSVVKAVNHAISRNVVAISISWAYTISNQALESAFQSAYNVGIACFASAGNENSDNTLVPHYPSNFSTVYAIGSVNKQMKLSVWGNGSASNYGDNEFVGNGSTVIKLTVDDSHVVTTGGGTSSATPHVASIYTAMKAVNPAITRETAISYMRLASYLKDGDVHKYGNGYPCAVEAIRLARMDSHSFTALPEVRNVPLNKEWVTTLSFDVDPTKLDGVYLLDTDFSENVVGREHPIDITVSGKKLTVKPTSNYKSNNNYCLVISDLYSTSGVKLSQNTTMAFKTV